MRRFSGAGSCRGPRRGSRKAQARQGLVGRNRARQAGWTRHLQLPGCDRRGRPGSGRKRLRATNPARNPSANREGRRPLSTTKELISPTSRSLPGLAGVSGAAGVLEGINENPDVLLDPVERAL
jgi:hypothetical protein